MPTGTASSAADVAIGWINEKSPLSLNGTIALGTAIVACPFIYWAVRRGKCDTKRALKWGPCALDAEQYVQCKLLSITKVSHNAAIYRFKLPKKAPLNLPIGKHVSLKATVGTREASRSYTPISDPQSVGYFDLLVKTYPTGCISKHLSELKLGEFIDVRGPKGRFEYCRNMASSLGMVAGGTGITPMYQVIKHILSDPKDMTTISLIYANVNDEDILLKDELEALAAAHPDRFKIYYTLDNPPKNWKMGKGFVTADMIKEHLPGPSKSTKILLCGPPPMITSMLAHCESLGYGSALAHSTEQSQVFKF